ncbi:hypothetical protein IC575_011258 [Cucumis melo]
MYSSNYTDVNGTIKLLNRHAVNNMKDVDMIHILINELIFGSDKIVYLDCEDFLHYSGMVEIDYIFILAYITFHWMLHVIDLRENCVYVLDSLRSKFNEQHRVEETASETRSIMLSINSKMETCKVLYVIIWKCGKVYWYFRCWMIVFLVVLYGNVEKCADIGGYIGRFGVVGLMVCWMMCICCSSIWKCMLEFQVFLCALQVK